MVRVAITVQAFVALAATMPLGSVGYEHRLVGAGRSAAC